MADQHGILFQFLRHRFSGHGYPRAANTPAMGSKFRRFFWLLCALGATGFAVYQVYINFELYLQYPTTTSVVLDQPDTIPFPAVTICPLSPVKRRIFRTAEGQSVHLSVLEDIETSFWAAIQALNNISQEQEVIDPPVVFGQGLEVLYNTMVDLGHSEYDFDLVIPRMAAVVKIHEMLDQNPEFDPTNRTQLQAIGIDPDVMSPASANDYLRPLLTSTILDVAQMLNATGADFGNDMVFQAQDVFDACTFEGKRASFTESEG